MNANQKLKILEVIERDAAIRHQYVNGRGETCIIGGLGTAAGFDVKPLFGTASNTLTIGRVNLTDLLTCIMKNYGLSESQIRQLQQTNDECPSRLMRKKHLTDRDNYFMVSDC